MLTDRRKANIGRPLTLNDVAQPRGKAALPATSARLIGLVTEVDCLHACLSVFNGG